jgi:hypothetical protein
MDIKNSADKHFKIMDVISDGKLYCADDVVNAGTGGCRNCSWCCEDMCDTIFLDPYDIYALQRGVGKEYKELLEENFIEVGLHHSGYPVVGNEDEIPVVMGKFVQQIIYPLRQMKHGLPSFVTVQELFLCLPELFSVAGSGFIFPEVLLK